MIALFFIVILQISFFAHLYFIVAYIGKKDDTSFKGFLVTCITNIFLGIFLTVWVLINPRELKVFNIDRMLFLESGLIFFFMLYVKYRVTKRIYLRTKDPAHFHYSYFGKKVIDASAVTGQDVMTYFLTLPLTLICGAYFVAKLGCF
jgi:hypothetical protein